MLVGTDESGKPDSPGEMPPRGPSNTADRDHSPLPMTSATQPPFLRVSDPVAGRQVVPLVTGERITLGRAPSNRIVVHDERASRFHAEVFSTDSGWMIRDLDSRNGTLLEGQLLVGDRRLEAGDSFQIGLAEVVYCEPGSVADTTGAAAAGGGAATGGVGGGCAACRQQQPLPHAALPSRRCCIVRHPATRTSSR